VKGSPLHAVIQKKGGGKINESVHSEKKLTDPLQGKKPLPVSPGKSDHPAESPSLNRRGNQKTLHEKGNTFSLNQGAPPVRKRPRKKAEIISRGEIKKGEKYPTHQKE